MITRHLGLTDYEQTWQAMRAFTDSRGEHDDDELWVCEHRPVYTLGQAGRSEHLLATGSIPVVQSDRGGQVTYHGPGQVVVYTLVNLRRCQLGVREMVVLLENAVIATLGEHGVHAEGRRDAPGVYVDGDKVAALGLRVRRGCTYHGVAMNIDADLTPFDGIDPCGYRGQPVTSTSLLGIDVPRERLIDALVHHIQSDLASASD